MKRGERHFEIPTRPYSPIDALNRKAAATGSPGYAMQTAHANYNGHNVGVNFNDYRGYHIAEYYWGERCVLARGSFAEALNAAVRYYDRGDLGASVSVTPRNGDAEALELIAKDERFVEMVRESDDLCARWVRKDGKNPRDDWWTWRHEAAMESVRDHCFPGGLHLIFDWELMQAAEDRDAYIEALKEKYNDRPYN
jgi:hypothetical protein